MSAITGTYFVRYSGISVFLFIVFLSLSLALITVRLESITIFDIEHSIESVECYIYNYRKFCADDIFIVRKLKKRPLLVVYPCFSFYCYLGMSFCFSQLKKEVE
jgi:hypothetical protein